MECVQLVAVALVFCFLGSCHSQVPVSVLKRLRKLTTAEFIDEFLRLKPTEVNSNNITGAQGQALSSSGRIPPNTRDRLLHNLAQPDFCSPRLVTVPIPQDPDPSVIRFPLCTLIERCAGCAGSEAEICAPVDVTYSPKLVLVSRYTFGASNHFQHQRTKIVYMEEHLTCETRCKVVAEDCDFSVHSHHDDETCRCICKNAHLESSCISPKRWNKQRCECICPFVENCDSRTYTFNTDTCRCERRFLSSASGLHSSANDPSGPMDTRDRNNSTVENTRGLITENDIPTTTVRQTTMIDTTPTTTKGPTTTPLPTSPTTPAEPCANHWCGTYWVPTLIKRGKCGCRPNFDIFSGR